jgi:chemotaxis protein CheX
MTQTIQISAVRDYLAGHLADVFDTMLSLKATVVPAAPLPPFGERVSGSVGFGGETVTGAVYLHLSAPFANHVTAAMLGLPPGENPGEADVNDVVGEATNMLTGGLKSWLCNAGADCAVSTPAIIRGTAFAIEPMPDVVQEYLVFDCGGEQFVVEFHIKLN